MARSATVGELALFRTPGKRSKLYAAFLNPTTVYTARINQTFSSFDSILEITYDGGSGTLANVLADMTLLIGSSAGAHDIGICRVRAIDATKIYIGETSDVRFADNQYLTILRDWSLWAKHVLIVDAVPFMDGGITYSDQHTSFDPVVIMGSHRALKLSGSTISASFDSSDSYVYDSSISAKSWSAPGSSASSGMTTHTPTITWNTTGWFPVFLTLTAANGKSFFGVRWVFIWSESNPPPNVVIENGRQDADAGGWEYPLTLYNADVSEIRERALVIVFAEDHYGDTQQSIGPLEGSENIRFVGWVGDEESITVDPEQGQVSFTAQGAHYWYGKIPAFPDGVEFTSITPTAWTQMKNLTVPRGLWHFLHWRTTATRIMDVFLPSDAKYTAECKSMGASLWDQIREIGFLQTFVRPGVNRYGQLYIDVHPNLIPEADRDYPIVMTITKQDWQAPLDFDRATATRNALVNLRGVAVNAAGDGAPFFSLSPGHALPHYGTPELLDSLLVANQAQANTLAGLYRGWQNNEFTDIPIRLSANNPLIDCFPNQGCTISIAAEDNVRGIAYDGDLIPKSVSDIFDAATGHLYTEVVFEAATFEDISMNGDIPGSRADISVPPLPNFPPLPAFPVLLPGTLEPTASGPKKILFHDPVGGFILAEHFETTPVYRQINAGLTTAQFQLANFMFVCPNGALYVGKKDHSPTTPADPDSFSFIARAPSVGATFEVLFTWSSFPSGADRGIACANCNPLQPEQVAIVMGTDTVNKAIYVGAAGTYTQGVTISGNGSNFPADICYGFGKWLYVKTAAFAVISADGSAITSSGSIGDLEVFEIRASTTAKVFIQRTGSSMYITEDNLATAPTVAGGAGSLEFSTSQETPTLDCDPTGTYLMMRYTGKGKSSDGGASWAGLPSLPVGSWYFAYAGPGDSASQRFIAAGAVVRYTPDFGATWVTKENSTLTDIYAFPTIDMLKVLDFGS